MASGLGLHCLPMSNKKDARLKLVKGIYSCPIEIISGLTDKGQFQCITGLKGPKEGTYLNKTEFLVNVNFSIKYLYTSWDYFITPWKEVIISS